VEEAVPGLGLEERPSCVLVVEDEALIRIFISQELRDSGFTVIEATTADEALRVLKNGVLVDVVFTDVQMPGTLNGLALAAIVAEQFEMPVIITSGHLTSPPPFDGFFRKPYQTNQVIAAINKLLTKNK
jgi:CheY-like chemotaxis protein